MRIRNETNNTLVSGSSDNDTMSNDNSYVTMDGGAGDDYMLSFNTLTSSNYEGYVTILGGDGNDTIKAFGHLAYVEGGAGDDSVNSGGANNTVIAGDGDDLIENYGSYSIIYGNAGNDSIHAYSTISSSKYEGYVTVLGGDGEDTIRAYGHLAYVEGGAGDDYLYTSGANNTVISGVGNDTIKNHGKYSIIYGNDGDDFILSHDKGDNSTLIGGAGNDTITLTSGAKNNVIVYNSGDGNDIIYGFDGNDTIKISGASYSTVTLGSDVLVNVDSSQITLAGVAGSSLNIADDSSTIPAPKPTVTPAPSDNAYVYSGGNVTLSSTESYYSGVKGDYTTYDQVNFTTDLLGFNISGDNISINSSSGTLKLSNTRGKYINYADGSGNPFAYSYIGVNEGSSNDSLGNSYSTVNNSYNTVYGVLIGGDNVNDRIYAGSGGSSLWGGRGKSGNDTLVGGAGVDEFVYKLGNGNDVIQNASSSDIVNLEGIKLSQITSIDTSAGVNAKFSDGGSLKILGIASVGIKVDGWTIAYDHSSNDWIVK